MKLKLKVDTFSKENFEGQLFFKTPTQNLTVDYFFNNGTPHKSLENGDEIDMYFKVGDTEFPLKGIYPNVIEFASEKVQCFWVLARDIIYENIFLINASTEGKVSDISSVSREISGVVPERALEVLFNEMIVT